MQFILEIKSNIYSKATLVIFTILLFLTCQQCVTFLGKYPYKDLTAEVLKQQLQAQRINIEEAEVPDIEAMSDEDIAVKAEFIRYNKHHLNRLKEQAAYIKKGEVKKANIIEFVYGIERMNYFSSNQKSNISGSVMFEHELQNPEIESIVAIDQLYSSSQKALTNSEAERQQMYEDSLQRTTLALYNVKSNSSTYKVSAINYLIELFESDSLFTILTPVLCLLYASLLLQGKQDTRSYMLYIQAKQMRFSSLFSLLVTCLLSFFAIWITAIMLPFLFTGMHFGFSGLDARILLYTNGLTSFQSYAHMEVRFAEGKYSFFQPIMDTGNYVWSYAMIPSVLKWNPVYTVAFPAAVLFMLKTFFYTVLGTVTIFCFKKKFVRNLLLLVWIGLYIVTMQHSNLPFSFFNPLCIGSSWEMTCGGLRITWLHAVILLFAWILLLFCVAWWRSKTVSERV